MNNLASTGNQIRKNIETLVLDHITFVDALTHLRKRVRDTLDGYKPCFEMLLGTSRSGKSEVLQAIARDFPSTMAEGVRNVPVLIVDAPSGGGTRALDEAVIHALGVPVPKNMPKLNKFMLVQLKRAGVRVILFDEVNHVVEKGSHIASASAGDYFKTVHTNAVNVGIVMSGIPLLRRLIDDNVQLRNRVARPIILPPYRFDDPVHRKAFANCVAAFVAEFEECGCHLTIDLNTMVRHSYLVSAGQVGLLSDFFNALAQRITTPCDITMELCEQASKSRNLPGDGYAHPFRDINIADDQLMGVLSAELDKYNLALPPLETTGSRAIKKASNVTEGSL